MCYTGTALVVTVFLLNVYFHTETPVPKWVKNLVIDRLAKCLCYTTSKAKQRGAGSDKRKSGIGNGKLGSYTLEHYDETVSPPNDGTESNITEQPATKTNHENMHSAVSVVPPDGHDTACNEWDTVARILDRLMFLIYIAAMFLLLLIGFLYIVLQIDK